MPVCVVDCVPEPVIEAEAVDVREFVLDADTDAVPVDESVTEAVIVGDIVFVGVGEGDQALGVTV